MKNTKKLLLGFFAIALVAAMMFVLASCGHEHEYTAAVTDPTCTERGYTTYTCSCGDSYVDDYVDASHDLVQHSAKEPNCTEPGNEAYESCKNCDYTTYVEIPSVGAHYYDMSVVKIPTKVSPGSAVYTCTGCGDSYSAEIALSDIELPNLVGAIASLIGDCSYSIDLGDGFNIICVEMISALDPEDLSESVEGTKKFIAIKLPKASLDVKGTDLLAELKVEVGIATVEFSDGEDPDEITLVDFDSESTYEFKVDGDKISYAVIEDGDSFEYEGSIYELILDIVSIYVDVDVEYEDILEVYAVIKQFECFAPVIENIAELIGAAETLEAEAESGILLDILLILGEQLVEVSTEGEDTVYTLKLENLSGLVEYLKTATVAEMLDGAFGEGFSENLSAFAKELPAMKVKEIADSAIALAETYELNVDEFYALVDGIVYLSAGVEFDIASQIESRYDYTLAMIVAELMGASGDALEEAGESFAASVSAMVDLILASTVDDLYGMMPKAEEEAPDVEEPEKLTDILSGIVAMLGEEVEFVCVVDPEGMVKNIEFYAFGMVSGSYESDGENVHANIMTGVVDVDYSYDVEDGCALNAYLYGELVLGISLDETDGGYAFDGVLNVSENSFNVYGDISADGEIEVWFAVYEGDELKASASVGITSDQLFFDLYAHKGDMSYRMMNLYVTLSGDIIESIEFDLYGFDGDEHKHMISALYLGDKEGRYFFEIIDRDAELVFALNFDGEAFRASVTEEGDVLFDLEAVISEGVLTSAKLVCFDRYTELDKATMTETVVCEKSFELSYVDNGDGTYALDVTVYDGEEKKMTALLDLVNGTLEITFLSDELTVLNSLLTFNEEKLALDLTYNDYDEDADVNQLDVDLEITADSATLTVVADEEITVLDAAAVLENGVITSASATVKSIYSMYDEESGNVIPMVSEAMRLTYASTEDGGTLTVVIANMYEAVLDVSASENGVKLDVTVNEFSPVLTDGEDDSEEISKRVIFDGELGINVSSDEESGAVTVSVDVDKIYSAYRDVISEPSLAPDAPEEIISLFIENIIMFDGEITFNYAK
jgi:hypothetical protein